LSVVETGGADTFRDLVVQDFDGFAVEKKRGAEKSAVQRGKRDKTRRIGTVRAIIAAPR